MNACWRPLLAVFLLTGSPLLAADSIFDFSDLDVVESTPAEKDEEPEARPPEDDFPEALPKAIRTILDKLDRFSTVKRTALMKEIAEGRKIASEILVKNAAASDAATRAALLTEAKRVKELAPERSLIDAAPASPARANVNALSLATGTWKKPNNKKWINILSTDGILVRPGGVTGTWRWLDEKRGVFVFDYTPKGSAAELVQIDMRSKPLKATVRTESNIIFTVLKTESAEKPALPAAATKVKPSDAVVKLAAHESTRRKETETLIQTKNTKVAAWLLQEAKNLPGPQARVAVERASELEGKPVSATAAKGAGDFAGVWIWTGKKLEFADDGSVKMNGAKAGKWIWTKATARNRIAFLFDSGGQACMVRLSKSQEGVMHVVPVTGKPTEAKRQ